MSGKLTTTQTELARHALGLPNSSRRSYRNRYFVSHASVKHQRWEAMVRLGFAGVERNATSYGDMFYLTAKGAKAVLEPGESLCPEDFPPATRAALKEKSDAN